MPEIDVMMIHNKNHIKLSDSAMRSRAANKDTNLVRCLAYDHTEKSGGGGKFMFSYEQSDLIGRRVR